VFFGRASSPGSGYNIPVPTLSKPIALGRTAEIHAWGDGRILKLYRDGFPPGDAEYELRLARPAHPGKAAAGEKQGTGFG